MPGRRPNHLTWRHRLLAAGVALLLVGLVVRLASIQLVQHEQYAAEAARTHSGAANVPAPRGAILDASGYPLATSIDTWDVYADSFLWRDAERASEAAQAVAAALGLDPAKVLADGTAQRQGDVVLRRGLPYEEGLALDEQGLWGVRLLPSSRRIYPEGDLAGSVVGYVGLDSTGLWGIESDFEQILRGKPGVVISERDPLGRPISFRTRSESAPQPGGEVQLTIDRFVQGIAERRLAEAVKQHSARGGSIVVMDPNTGAILAMASLPTVGASSIDLDDPKSLERVRNRALTDLYEPGSVIKTLTTAIALDTGKASLNSSYVDTGAVEVGTYTIKNWDFSANGPTTLTQYLQRSLNTGSVWLSGLIGARDFYRYMQRFGIGEQTHVGLSGEAEGLVRTPEHPDWYPVDLATNSYGQGLAATPLQVLTAVNVFANGGKLMRPYVVARTAGRDGERTFAPVEVRQVVSPETAKTMAHLMNQVVDGVENHGAQVPGYKVAGTTGTTLVSIPTGYDIDSTIASFAGFLPYEAPRVSILVKIDQPSGGLNLGGQVSAPVFSKVAADIMQYLDVAPAPNAPRRVAR